MDWIEFGRALAGLVVVSGLMALSIIALWRGGEGPALEIMIIYASLTLVLFGLKEGLFNGGGPGGGGGGHE